MRTLAIAGALLVAVAAQAAESNPLEPPKYVRGVEARIRDEGKLAETRKELSTGTDGGGDLVLSAKAGQPRKMVVSLGLSNRMIVRTFFYVDGKVALMAERVRFYKWEPKTETLNERVFSGAGEESRYYFKDGVLVFWTTVHDRTALSAGSHEVNGTLDGEAGQILRSAEYFLKAAHSGKSSVDVEAFLKGGTK